MRKLPKPKADIAAVFDICINTFTRERDVNDVKKRFSNVRDVVIDASNDYDKKAQRHLLHTLTPSDMVGKVSKSEFESLYNYRFVKRQEGRKIYDQLKSVPYARCPLCNQRRVSTLDHYLPISEFPVFAITPFNLVPACFDCNKIKLAKVSTAVINSTLHPYYDDIESDEWLQAIVVKGDPVVLEYKIVPPTNWNSTLASRVIHHFNTFELNDLYGAHAAEEIAGLARSMKRIYDAGGPFEVQEDLIRSFNEKYEINKNSWQTAMFKALGENSWYHNSFNK